MNLNATSTEFDILELLRAQGDLYGLELTRQSKMLNPGNVYVYLARMEKKGFVEALAPEASTRGPKRRRFRITGLGERVLACRELMPGLALSGGLA